MDFLKKHYEKVVLSVLLLAMAVAAALLPLKVSQVREELQQAVARSGSLDEPGGAPARPEPGEAGDGDRGDRP